MTERTYQPPQDPDQGPAPEMPEPKRVVIPALDEVARQALREEVGLVQYTGGKPFRPIMSPTSEPTGSVQVGGVHIPTGFASFSRSGGRRGPMAHR